MVTGTLVAFVPRDCVAAEKLPLRSSNVGTVSVNNSGFFARVPKYVMKNCVLGSFTILGMTSGPPTIRLKRLCAYAACGMSRPLIENGFAFTAELARVKEA